MNAKTFSRRTVLRGAAGVTVALPFLESFAPRAARAQANPKRLIVFFTPEGTQSSFFPTGAVDNFQMGAISMPLEPYKSDLVMFKGVDHASCRAKGSDHSSSMVHMLTGGGPDSIDQIVARQIGKGARFPSMQLGVKPRAINDKGMMVYSGGKLIPSEYNPLKVYASMFTGGVISASNGTGASLQEIFARRKSVLDYVNAQLNGLKKVTSGNDQKRLDQHLTSLRDVEKSLTTPPVAIRPDCASPQVQLMEGPNTGGTQPFDQLTKIQIDLLSIAVSCQLSPVVSLQLGNSGSGETFPFLGIPSGQDVLHGWVHNDNRQATFPEYARKTFTWFATQFAYLLGKLKSQPEGPGTLLDNCLVAWCSHFGNGGAHSPNDVPWVLAGKAGGALRTGRFLDFSAAKISNSQLLIGVAQAMGVSINQLGDPRFGTAPPPGLL